MHHSNSVKINKTEFAFSNFPSIGYKNSTQVHSNVASLTLSFHKLSLLAGLIDGHNTHKIAKNLQKRVTHKSVLAKVPFFFLFS